MTTQKRKFTQAQIDGAAGRGYQLGGLYIPVVNPEPCQRLVQIGRGIPVNCQCSRCRARSAAEIQT